ncbi:MAG: VOC family protein [Saprospiraceae bacterium]|nr:VOC family protein [Saprospiraceae bacterium]
MSRKKVTGIGGIFFKCDDVNKMKEWYQNHLGIKADQYGASFVSRQYDDPEKSSYLQWSPFSKDSEYFHPSSKEYMINYRVENLELLVEELKEAGITICDNIESYDYGKFVHIMDPEGNKIELWEPVDKVFDKYFEDDPNREANK